MFSFHPMTASGHLNDSSGAVSHRKVPSLGAVVPVIPPRPSGSRGEGSPSSSSSPSFLHAHAHQLVQRADGTSPAGVGTLPPGAFPHLQPFFTALARNMANMSPQQQQPTTAQRNHPATSTPSNSSSNAISSPFCGLINYAHPSTFLARQQNQKQQQSSPPVGVSDVQQQFMANWLNMLMAMNNHNSSHNVNNNNAGGAPQPEASKTLESDSDGNSVCPACKEPIGKEPTQWESHLEAERSRLKGEIESLRAAVLDDFDTSVSQSAETTTAAAHQQDQPLGEAEIALERIRESQRRRISAKVRGHFFMTSPIMASLIGDNAGTEAAMKSLKQEEDGTDAIGDSGGPRQGANGGFTVSPFSALELARGHNEKEVEQLMSPEGMKRMSPEEVKRVSPEGTKRMSPEWQKRIGPEDIKRPRMEL
uniref:Uncharacterized protein n=1 Tax=Globodera rostochiensis TaxID=31243 RepID=A0A914HC82_GLORO